VVIVAVVRCHVLWLLSCGCGAVPMYCGRLVTAFQTNLLSVYLPSVSLKIYTAHIWSIKIHGVTSQKIQILVMSVIRNLRYQSHVITFFYSYEQRNFLSLQREIAQVSNLLSVPILLPHLCTRSVHSSRLFSTEFICGLYLPVFLQ